MNSEIDIILKVRNFSAGFLKDGEVYPAVDRISFDLRKGETLGIVGESGCGKSVTALSIMRLLPVPSGKYIGGEILYRGKNLLAFTPEEMRKVRGNSIAMIFQEPMTALNPVKKIGRQITEVFELHRKDLKKAEMERETLSLLEKVGIPDPLQRMSEYPHQLSGGMRQRVMIAIALACKPDILIADEPTTALDVTIQAQILDLIKELQRESGMSVIFITHDLGVIAELCDDVVVMYAGRVAEKAPADALFVSPMHPYTSGLLESIPKFEYKRKTRLKSIEGMVPSITDYPEGCRFRNRCTFAFEPCSIKHPDEVEIAENHKVNCFRYGG
ncbi:MAG TPA: ABC transporter ATP-binding protein [Spirochaetota bacterium]|nr:ABC transporter ATP-binding protein [Spirochaetota bacterium]HPS85956.1 ABC transporter ATP-binding protein [Spirochaetota bacterium]